MEPIIFLVIVAAIGLIRWLAQVAETKKVSDAAKRAGPPTPNAPVQRTPPQSEEERVRKFMEALGVPTSNAPPPRVQPRQIVPKVPRPAAKKMQPIDSFPRPRSGPWSAEPVVVIQPPPLVVAAPSAPAVLPPERAARITASSLPPRAPAEFDVQKFTATASAASSVTPSESNWIARLATADGLRDAVILREIFGPPRGLQSIG